MIQELVLPVDLDQMPCPLMCGRMTEDPAGGPCRECWRQVGGGDEGQSDMGHELFMVSAASHCRCVHGPCDGVLAGGLCDGFDEAWEESQRRDGYGVDYDD